MNTELVKWLMGNDTGASSRTILAWMERDTLGVSLIKGGNHPLDPDDLGRCIRLMDIEPSYRTRILEMTDVSPYWAALVPHWTQLEILYREALPSRWAAKCYDRMRELLQPVERASMEQWIAIRREKETP